MRRGVDALRIGAILLAVGVTLVAIPATVSLVVQRGRTPWWFDLGVTGLVAGVIALAAGGAVGRGTTRLAARLHAGVVLAATLLLPVVAESSYTVDTPPWVHAYLTSAIAGCVLASRRWALNLGLGLALILSDLWMRAEVWEAPVSWAVNDLLFELTVFAMGAAVLTSVALAQRGLEREAAATAERFLVARATEQLGRRGAQWDGLVHDEILAALETIAIAPPDVDVRELARATIDGLGEGPPSGDVDHVAFRGSVLEAVLTEYPTASTRCVATTDARVLPHDAAEALLMAVTEALRNAAEHAFDGRHAGAVSLRLNHGPDRVALEVSDRGRGFERADVGPTSFGLALSIEGRVGAVGGLATVMSRPGHGTTVRMQWPAAEAS